MVVRLFVGVWVVLTSAPLFGAGFHSPSSVPFEPVSPLPYHNGETLVCTDCHNVHFSVQHDASGKPSSPLDGGPSSILLKYDDPLDVCLSCHNHHSGVPDVVGADANGLEDRSAGFFQTAEGGGFQGHKLGRNLEAVCDRCHGRQPGSIAVTCIDCHEPHGNGRPRNLRWASLPGFEPQFGLLVDPSAAGMSPYESVSVAYGTTASDSMREVTSICIDCHHAFSGSAHVGASGGYVRHPSFDSERASTNVIADGAGRGTTSPLHWTDGSGAGFDDSPRVRFIAAGATTFAAARSIDPGTNGVFCLTCHKAHGSEEAFGLAWHGEATGCRQCHADE